MDDEEHVIHCGEGTKSNECALGSIHAYSRERWPCCLIWCPSRDHHVYLPEESECKYCGIVLHMMTSFVRACHHPLLVAITFTRGGAKHPTVTRTLKSKQAREVIVPGPCKIRGLRQRKMIRTTMTLQLKSHLLFTPVAGCHRIYAWWGWTPHSDPTFEK